MEMLQDQNYKALGSITYRSLPKIGYVAVLHKQPIAAGFLRRVEGGYAQIDTLVTNPYFGSQIRHAGIDMVVDSLLQSAKDLNLLGVIAFTENESVLKRSIDRGFQVISQTVLIKV